jgi:integrative and conjugative element protein (TIGR02256 family)
MKREMLFDLPDGRKLLLRECVVHKMIPYQQHKPTDAEAGGILIGRILVENDHFIIDDVSEPMPTDIRKRARFKRSSQGHQDYYNAVWAANRGHCFYLGEWHTHPESDPVPSFVDVQNWIRIMRLPHETDTLFFVILGTENLRVWHGDRKTLKITRLNEVY